MERTIQNILRQRFQNYELLVWDDCSVDDTKEVVLGIKDDRIVYHKNPTNLGYGRNLQECYEDVSGEIVFLMGDDDLLLDGALQRTHEAFLKGERVGVVTRPYYWFWQDPRIPIRVIPPLDVRQDSEISIFDGPKAVAALFRSAGQLSGLALRREYIEAPFHSDVFPAHVYPFASILKRHKAIYLKDFTVAIRAPLSMTTHRSNVYSLSPIGSWIEMFETIFSSNEYETVRKECIDFVIRDTYVGLLQIKTATSSLRKIANEIALILKYRPRSVVDQQIYFYSLLSIILPATVLRKALDWYKVNLLSRQATGWISHNMVGPDVP